MIITERTQFLVDGDPVEELSVEGSRFDRISLRLGTDEIEVRAKDVATEDVLVETFDKIENKLYKPVIHEQKARRDIDDDIQDALGAIGFAAIDATVREHTDDDETHE